MFIIVLLAIGWRVVARVLEMRCIFCWLLCGGISHPTSQSTFVVIASGDTTYQGTLVVVVSQSTALIAVIL